MFVCNSSINYLCIHVGIQVNLEALLPSDEAKALTYEYQTVQVYSNSYGPDDRGFTVAGPSVPSQESLIEATSNVRHRVHVHTCIIGSRVYAIIVMLADVSSVHSLSTVATTDFNLNLCFMSLCRVGVVLVTYMCLPPVMEVAIVTHVLLMAMLTAYTL